MSLEKYVDKRDFTKTSEPKSGKSKDGRKLLFVIQKHDATRLHYDFRLEMDGVLKSWAVPKGPSTDPKIKRLAMMVEDHPYDYRDFEGIIPKGEYGGGTVIVWDTGTYEPIADIKGKKAQEKYLLNQLEAGSVKIKLNGEKLQGEFALVKTHGMGENGWLLIKHKDDYASAADILKNENSVLSGKTLKSIEETSDKVWKNGHEQTVKAGRKKAIELKAESLQPMLATLADKPFDDPGWLYEIKWDGYRALSFVNNGTVELMSRNSKTFNEKFSPIHDLLTQWKINAVIDGEILVLNEKGLSDFGKLQNWRSEADGELVYYVFDLLWYDGHSVMELPLTQRRSLLQEILPAGDDRIRISQVFETGGIAFFNQAKKIGLEGILAKKADSTYTPNLRSKEWLKIKIQKRQEMIIAGYTKNEGTSKQFSSILLGVYEDGKLQYAGKAGTGFSDALQKEMMASFKPLISSKSPFTDVPDVNKASRFRPNPPKLKATWLKPELVCEVGFTEITADGVFRHPSFLGMREDKKAEDVVREKAVDIGNLAEDEEINSFVKKTSGLQKEKIRRSLLNPNEETQVKKINGHDLKFTHLSKAYWPEDGVTKRDMLNYYYRAAEYILPYLKGRPQSLNRFPNGINGSGFYQKNVKDTAPDWAETFPYTNGEGEHREFLVATNEASLLWMASLGCMEMNPWFSRVASPDHPDYCVIDLDPNKNTFDQVIQAAQEVKNVLDAIDVPCFCKTSGSTGMHIYIPMGAKYSYEQSQIFANIVVETVHRQIPDFTSLERSISKRKGKMYLDYLQNRPGATLASAYSLRPKPGATVSMPLHWDEVKPGLTMSQFTIFNAMDRVRETGDLFEGVLEKGIDLEKAIRKAKSTFLK